MNVEGVLVAVFGGVSGVIGAWALLVKARGESARPLHLLRRLVDALQSLGLWERVPVTLRTEIEDHMRDDEA